MLKRAVQSYRDGIPLVVFDEREQALHGADILETMGSLTAAYAVTVIRGVPHDYFESSAWPTILEAARQEFVLKRK